MNPQPRRQAVEHDEAGLPSEDALEARARFAAPSWRGGCAIGRDAGGTNL